MKAWQDPQFGKARCIYCGRPKFLDSIRCERADCDNGDDVRAMSDRAGDIGEGAIQILRSKRCE